MGMVKGYKQTEEHKKKKALSCRRGKSMPCKVCSKEMWRKPSDIKAGNTAACSRVCYYKYKKGRSIIFKGVRQHLIGSNNPNWKGGKSRTPIRIARGSGKNKVWRKAVLERDNYTCQFCGFANIEREKRLLHVDHIKPFSKYPELRFDLSNGRVLCVPCHRKVTNLQLRGLNADTNGKPLFCDINGN